MRSTHVRKGADKRANTSVYADNQCYENRTRASMFRARYIHVVISSRIHHTDLCRHEQMTKFGSRQYNDSFHVHFGLYPALKVDLIPAESHREGSSSCYFPLDIKLNKISCFVTSVSLPGFAVFFYMTGFCRHVSPGVDSSFLLSSPSMAELPSTWLPTTGALRSSVTSAWLELTSTPSPT